MFLSELSYLDPKINQGATKLEGEGWGVGGGGHKKTLFEASLMNDHCFPSVEGRGQNGMLT